MAKQHGVIKLTGTLGDVTFYQNRYGYQAQTKKGISREKLMTDPAFARFRENIQEFTAISRAGKYLRDTINVIAFQSKDKTLVQRVVKLMKRIKNLDLTSIRGLRTPGTALQDASVRELLKGFEFNDRAHLTQVLFHLPELDAVTGTITLEDFNVQNSLLFPVAATHVELSCAWAQINFANGMHVLKSSAPVVLDRNASTQTLTLTPAAMPPMGWTSVYLLKIEFYQEVNGVQYGLSNGEFNVLSVVGVGV